MGTRAASIVAVVLVTGCGGNAEYRCDSPGHSCGTGTCELTTGFCSVPDSSCSSGRRYDGTLAGDLSGQCVGGGSQPSDAGVDVGIDTPPPDAPLSCYGTAPISICFAAAPTGAQMYSGTIDTGSSSMCATNVVSGGSGFCVLAAGTITIDSKLRGTGTKPLVLLATDSITIGGGIDVGSHRNATPETGAGADPAECTTMAGTPPTMGGGGAGGSFVGRGGAGAVSGKAASTGGVSGLSATNITLRGGCPGQSGDGSNPGTGGHGGGAVLLIAVNSITIGNDITAGGEGGAGGSINSSGGGGGGAGGMIWLDAPVITNTNNRLVLANGGAGGEGSGLNAGSAGDPGEDSTTTTAASGGHQGPTNGGDGGDGSTGASAGGGEAGNPGTNPGGTLPGGGGAGGGGAGLIKTRAGIDLGTKVSPTVTLQ